VDRPGIRQFLKRGQDKGAKETGAVPSGESGGSALAPLSVSSLGAILLAADGALVVLSWMLLTESSSWWGRATAVVGMLGGAVLGVLGITLLAKNR
jgi:hypothetical protein